MQPAWLAHLVGAKAEAKAETKEDAKEAKMEAKGLKAGDFTAKPQKNEVPLSFFMTTGSNVDVN